MAEPVTLDFIFKTIAVILSVTAIGVLLVKIFNPNKKKK
jgi:hypothetical protein